jgi:hypothetical protein
VKASQGGSKPVRLRRARAGEQTLDLDLLGLNFLTAIEREITKQGRIRMSRLVATQPGDNSLHDYLERVAKYVPVEIIGAYLVLQSIFTSATADRTPSVEFVFYGLLVIATALYLLRFGGDVPHRARQAAIGTISFVIWTYGIGGWFWTGLGKTVLQPSISGGLVVVWSLAIGLFKPTDEGSERPPADAVLVGR